MMREQDIGTTTVMTPLGRMGLRTREGVLLALAFDAASPTGDERSATSSEIVRRLTAYFAGDLTALAEIPVAPVGTPFQLQIWDALRCLQPGEVVSYGELARRVGRPRAVRAVGAANARNPIALVVPCHRVIGQDGDLTGYASGLWRKAWLLGHEGYRVATPAAQSGQLPLLAQVAQYG